MHEQLTIDDYLAGEQARNAALAQVEANGQGWFDLAYSRLEQLALSGCDGFANLEHGVTGEDIAAMLRPQVGRPHHPNAIGALICKAVRRGLLAHTGQYRKMRNAGSHARRTPVYRFELQS